jgi:hypothetical protein
MRRVRAGYYDVLDLGSSTGGSIEYCMRRFNAPHGLGIDRLVAEVKQIHAAGYDAIQADVLTFDAPPGSFRFVSMMDFLEHLPDVNCVERVLGKAKEMARDFLFMRHPSFDDEHYLNAIGLKQFWTDWPGGHTAKVLLSEYTAMFQRLGLHFAAIFLRHPAHDSNHPAILPISALPNQHEYDAEQHGPKPHLEFPRPLDGQIDIFVPLRPFALDEWKAVIAPFD